MFSREHCDHFTTRFTWNNIFSTTVFVMLMLTTMELRMSLLSFFSLTLTWVGEKFTLFLQYCVSSCTSGELCMILIFLKLRLCLSFEQELLLNVTGWRSNCVWVCSPYTVRMHYDSVFPFYITGWWTDIMTLLLVSHNHRNDRIWRK